MDRQKISITIVEAKDLPAKERHGADPYVLIKEKKGMKLPDKGVKTEVQKKTLTPKWNQSFEFEFSYKLASLTFKIYDWDRFSSDDLLGKVHVPTDKLFYGPIDTWFPVTHRGEPAGQLHLVLNARFEYPLAIPNTVIPIHAQQFSLGLGWDQSKKGKAIDLDASIAFLDFGRQMVGKVNFQQLTAFGGAVKHSGDDRTGDGEGDDETIRFQLPNLPPNVGFIVVMINSFSEQPLSQVKSAYFRLLNEQNQCVCWWRLSQMAQQIGLLMGFLYRAQTGGGWAFLNRSHGCGGRTVEESIPQVLDQLTF